MVEMEGVHAKFERADEQAYLLATDIDAFCKSQKQLIRHHRNSQGQVWRYEGDTPTVPPQYPARAAEIVHNLRSALDHFVWQLVLANGKEPGPWSGYPISRLESSYREMVEHQLKGVSERAKQAIELHQPFQPPGGLGYHLWLLDVVNNLAKRRTLNMVVTVAEGSRSPDRRRPLAKDMTLMRTDDSHTDYDVDLLIDVVFGYFGPPQSSSRGAPEGSWLGLLASVEQYGPVNQQVVTTLYDLVGDIRMLMVELCGWTGLPAPPMPLLWARGQE